MGSRTSQAIERKQAIDRRQDTDFSLLTPLGLLQVCGGQESLHLNSVNDGRHGTALKGGQSVRCPKHALDSLEKRRLASTLLESAKGVFDQGGILCLVGLLYGCALDARGIGYTRQEPARQRRTVREGGPALTTSHCEGPNLPTSTP